MNKKLIRLTESDLHNIVKESVNKILVNEFDDWDAHLQQDDDEPTSFEYDDSNDYNPLYDELIKKEMHRLADLERQVPQHLKGEIHQCVATLESILSDINMRNDIARI